ncbi:MAG: Omp28 family outer membrane lipoprotein [Bacteroidales bacterium]
MTQKIKTSLLLLGISSIVTAMLCMASCTKIDEGDFLIPAGLPEWKGQYILLEEYTAHRCPNCPSGAKTAADMSNLLGDKLIVVGLHVSDLAAPAPGFTVDYRTEAGTIYEGALTNVTDGLPTGLLNRTLFNKNLSLPKGDWAVNAMNLYKKQAVAKMDIAATMAADKRISIAVNADFTSEYQGKGDIHLITWIVEDSLISRQLIKDQPNDPKYVHRHVMRGAVEGAWGQKVAEPLVPAQHKINKTLEIVADPSWKPQHLYVVSFLCDNQTREIIQVIETHVKVIQ